MASNLMSVVKSELALYTALKAEQARTGETWEAVAARWNAKAAAHNAKIDAYNEQVLAQRAERQAAANRAAHQAEVNSRCDSCFTVHAGECL